MGADTAVIVLGSVLCVGQGEKDTYTCTTGTNTASKCCSVISCMGRLLVDLLSVKTKLRTSQAMNSQLH